jgi:hypothetical protein
MLGPLCAWVTFVYAQVHEHVILEEFVSPYKVKFKIPVTPEGPTSLSFVAAVVHGRYIGVDVHCQLSGKDIVAELPAQPADHEGLQSWEHPASPVHDSPTPSVRRSSTTGSRLPSALPGIAPVQDIVVDITDPEDRVGSAPPVSAPASPPSLRAVAPTVAYSSLEGTARTDPGCPDPVVLPALRIQRAPHPVTLPAQKRRRTSSHECSAQERPYSFLTTQPFGDHGHNPAALNSWSQPNPCGFGRASTSGQAGLPARFPIGQGPGKSLSSLLEQAQPAYITNSKQAVPLHRERSFAGLPECSFLSQVPDMTSASTAAPATISRSDHSLQFRRPTVPQHGASEALKLMDAWQNRQGTALPPKVRAFPLLESHHRYIAVDVVYSLGLAQFSQQCEIMFAQPATGKSCKLAKKCGGLQGGTGKRLAVSSSLFDAFKFTNDKDRNSGCLSGMKSTRTLFC